jgi:hypothetical protein
MRTGAPIGSIAGKNEGRGNRRVFTLLLSVGLAIPLLLIVARIWPSWKVRSDLKALRQAGYPTTMTEFGQEYYPEIKPEENGALYFAEAFKYPGMTNLYNQMRPFWKDSILTPLPTRATPENQAKLIQILEANYKFLDALHERHPAETFRYPIDIGKGYEMLLPHLRRIQDATGLLLLEAISNANLNRVQAEMDDLRSAFRLSRSITDEPILISQLVGMRCRQMIVSALEDILQNQALTDSELLELSNLFHDQDRIGPMKTALIEELCCGIQLFEGSVSEVASAFNDSRDSSDSTDLRTTLQIMRISGVLSRDQDYYMASMKELIEISQLPFPSQLDTAEIFSRKISRNGFRPLNVCSGMLLPGLTKVSSRRAEDIARTSVIQTVLAIERYRLANENRLPDDLEKLVPSFLAAAPKDPFDGKPLRFKKPTKGYVVYSIGPDRKDDGGGGALSTNHVPIDITFTVER